MNGIIIAQSGVIPYRVRRGRVEVALVTTSRGPHWTIPKGHVEPDLDPQDSAAKEAYEEAGLVGEVHPRSVGAYLYEKRGSLRKVRIYLMAVTGELKRWPEMHRRERRWMPLDEAQRRVRNNPDLQQCLQRTAVSIQRVRRPMAA